MLIYCMLDVADSPETAKREIGIFFPEFNYDEWFVKEEPKFHTGCLKFIPEKFVHLVEQ